MALAIGIIATAIFLAGLTTGIFVALVASIHRHAHAPFLGVTDHKRSEPIARHVLTGVRDSHEGAR
jgi:hypothetical protein